MNYIYTVNDISKVLSPIFVTYHIRKAVLFGSYSKGMASEFSDIDLLVDSGLKGLRFDGFIEDVRKAVGKDVDVLDITHIMKNSNIEKEIEDSGVIIYEG